MIKVSKFGCTCGHVIFDQTDNLPYKGELFGDQDWERIWGAAAEFAVLGPEERAAWVHRHFGSQYPADLPASGVISDLITSAMLPFGRTVYECEACGTLWVQIDPRTNRFQGYAPREGNVRGILRSAAESDAPGEAESNDSQSVE